MVVRLHNLGKWAVLGPGEILELKGGDRRKVRIEVNAVAPARLDVVEGDKATFLAVVEGHEVVEFVAGVDAYVSITSEDEVWYFTNEGDQVASEKPLAVSLTEIANRRSRNPELERLMFKAEQNMNRRLAALEAENAAIREAMEAAQTETEASSGGQIGDGTADGTSGTAESAPEGGSEPPDEGEGGTTA